MAHSKWDDRMGAAIFGGLLVVVVALASAFSIWALSAAVSYASCEINPTSDRCVAIAKRDASDLENALGVRP